MSPNYTRQSGTTASAAAALSGLEPKQAKNPSFHHPPGDEQASLCTLALPGANGLSCGDAGVTGLTKILLLRAQSQNPAPGDG